MKKNILKLSFVACIAIMGLASCNSTPEKKAEDVEAAKENLIDAQDDLQQARIDSINDYNDFQKESEMKLQSNDESIALLKEKIKTEKKEVRIKLEENLDALKEKNAKLKIRMAEYKSEGKTNWEEFKQDVNKEIDELGKAISEAAQKNK